MHLELKNLYPPSAETFQNKENIFPPSKNKSHKCSCNNGQEVIQYFVCRKAVHCISLVPSSRHSFAIPFQQSNTKHQFWLLILRCLFQEKLSHITMWGNCLLHFQGEHISRSKTTSHILLVVKDKSSACSLDRWKISEFNLNHRVKWRTYLSHSTSQIAPDIIWHFLYGKQIFHRKSKLISSRVGAFGVCQPMWNTEEFKLAEALWLF